MIETERQRQIEDKLLGLKMSSAAGATEAAAAAAPLQALQGGYRGGRDRETPRGEGRFFSVAVVSSCLQQVPQRGHCVMAERETVEVTNYGFA